MVRFSSQQGIFFKLWHLLLAIYSVFVLFIVSLCKKNPKAVKKEDATPFKTSSYNPYGKGGGGGPPGSNIKGLPAFRGTSRFPAGGGG